MHITLLRHTAVDVPPGLCYGRTDVPVAANYASALTTLAAEISSRSFTHVYSSPATRCRQLAEDVEQGTVCLDARLYELDFGSWEGRLWDSISLEESLVWTQDFVQEAPPGGETFAALVARVQTFLSWLALHTEDHSSHALIVTHAGVIRAAACLCYGTPLQHAFDLSVSYGELFRMDYDPTAPIRRER